MTEWEKLQAGLYYADLDADLIRRRLRAKKLFRAYNKTDDEETALRRNLLKSLFRSVGTDVMIEPDFYCEFGENITIGNHVFINARCSILDCAEVVIGDHVLIGPDTGIYAVNHALDAQERIAGACHSSPVRIGKNSWLGGHVTVLAGVEIGENTVIGAGSVVTKSIPDGVLAMGNPCRVYREITQADRVGYPQCR